MIIACESLSQFQTNGLTFSQYEAMLLPEEFLRRELTAALRPHEHAERYR